MLKSKRRDQRILVDVIIPTNLVCVLFDPVITTSSFNYIVFYTCIQCDTLNDLCLGFIPTGLAA